MPAHSVATGGFRLGPIWPTCSGICKGARLGADQACLAHLKPEELTSHLERWKDGETLDARGVTIDGPLFDRIWTAAAELDGHKRLANVDFTGATFLCDVWFTGARFQAAADFREATFGGQADFSGVTFDGSIDFSSVRFSAAVEFIGTTFRGFSRFENARFEGFTHFGQAVFCDQALFGRSTFAGPASFDQSRFDSFAVFDGCTFEVAADLGRVLALKGLSLERAVFGESLKTLISAPAIKCTDSTFGGGVKLGVRFGEVACGGCTFGKPSIISSFGPIFAVDPEIEAKLRRRDPKRDLEFSERPRLVSLRHADVANLLLSGVDLRACRFAGAYNLDKLRIEGDTVLAHSPKGWSIRQPWPPRKYWSRRRTVAEEHEWRDRQEQLEPATAHDRVNIRSRPQRARRPWYAGTPVESPDWLGTTDMFRALSASEIASLYRALRKRLEDQKDVPGAADFYYGEMEMRRHDHNSPVSERLILWCYWLVSGYGLRASRALMCLVITILVFAPLFYLWGFQGSARTALGSVLFTAESTTSLFHSPDRSLTYVGEALDMGLRLLGPLFFGLGLLALRGRVHR